MGFFAPWFLAGLAGLALPLYLHLLKRQTRTPKQVSSLMFFESRTQASTRHRRLRYFLLLSLRMLLLLLLIVAFLQHARGNAPGRRQERGHERVVGKGRRARSSRYVRFAITAHDAAH